MQPLGSLQRSHSLCKVRFHRLDHVPLRTRAITIEKGMSGADPSSGPQAYMLPDARCLRLRRSMRDVLARARVPLLEGAKPQLPFQVEAPRILTARASGGTLSCPSEFGRVRLGACACGTEGPLTWALSQTARVRVPDCGIDLWCERLPEREAALLSSSSIVKL